MIGQVGCWIYWPDVAFHCLGQSLLLSHVYVLEGVCTFNRDKRDPLHKSIRLFKQAQKIQHHPFHFPIFSSVTYMTSNTFLPSSPTVPRLVWWCETTVTVASIQGQWVLFRPGTVLPVSAHSLILVTCLTCLPLPNTLHVLNWVGCSASSSHTLTE